MTTKRVTKAKTQNEKILGFLQKGGELTRVIANRRFRVRELSARICELRAAGHNIGRRFVSDKGHPVAAYFIPVAVQAVAVPPLPAVVAPVPPAYVAPLPTPSSRYDGRQPSRA